MTKILGIDLGTNSIGLAVRDTEKGVNLKEQLDFITSVIFKSGVGSGKSGEFSYAAERTKKRSTRRLYQSRKYRIWETLAVLIENGYCPLNKGDLEKWSKYDKEKGLKRQYPVNVEKFEQWVRLDFNGDGVADYTSPYQLRAELMQRQFDFSQEIERYKLGRALYHIAQRRGFKSSKGETIQEQESDDKKEISDDLDITYALKKSEEKKSGDLVAYMKANNLPTVGCAYAQLEKEGVRIRKSNYQAVRSQYKDEIKQIFEFQNGLNTDSDFYKRIVSEKKGEGTIFYNKRPLRSQKGLVGLCTLEPNKPRCAISHPDFEKFRAWSFINNIQYRNDVSSEWKDLTLEQKSKLYNDKFLRAKNNFDFFEIREWIEKTILNSDGIHNYKLIYDNDKKKRTINYKDNTNVSACPISARLKNILGENWENAIIKSQKERIDKKTGASHIVTYTAEDLWHVCFSFDEVEYVEEFAKNDLQFDEKKIKQMAVLWGAISQGYSMLSLKAIRNINRFLQRGMIYTNAVLLAKLPDIFGEDWEKYEKDVVESLDEVIRDNNKQRVFYTMANTLIANYKSINYTDRFAEHDQTYLLQQNDYDGVEGLTKGIKNVVSEYYGEQTWKSKSEEEQQDIIKEVATLYQQFFASSNRDYFKIPKVAEALANYLITNFPFLDSNTVIKKIYHPSMIEFYKPAKRNAQGFKLLGSPVIGALKNPMAMRVLHNLKKQINELILSGTIDEDTKIVVETARELNDANMRWAIAEYQKQRELENKEIEKRLQEYKGTSANIGSEVIEKAKLLLDQFNIDNEERGSDIQLNSRFKKDVTKYKLWLEQGCKCIYTGKIINLTSLFDDNQVDFEHTIPRSISFDNSLSNLTVCDAYFNRKIKKNQIPSQLTNYQEILTRIKPWMDKVVALKDNIEYWKKQSKRAATKDRKDQCIRQRHLWEMELEYWQKKVNAFTITEVSSGFRNNQLVDTRIITKYAYHYLKTVFNKVEVQKGSVTADFRKMLGIQSLDEKKSRDKHSHHAIDATMLTLVPSSSQRDKMLQLFYEKIENKDNAYYSKALQDEIKKCGFGSIQGVDEFIENNILINHIQKDQVLTPAHKRMRTRNKVVWQRDSDNNIVLDEHGNPIPKRWITGDSIRGQLHGDSFYGAITKAQTEGNTLLRNEDGSIKIEEQVYYVIRRELKYKTNSQDSGFSSWDDLKKSIVNKDLIPMMKSQFPEGTSFKDACMQGIYMLDKKGNKVAKIRHIRCHTSIKNPLAIKKQTYISNKPYKQNYYAEVGELYVMCKYQNDVLKNLYQPYNLFDIVQNRQLNNCDIPYSIENKGSVYKLKQILKKGDMLLLYKDSVEELKNMDNSFLTQRLYVIEGFETGGNHIVMRKHINAQASSSLGKGESIKDFYKMPERIRCGINTLHFLVKDTDFKMSSNSIVFL